MNNTFNIEIKATKIESLMQAYDYDEVELEDGRRLRIPEIPRSKVQWSQIYCNQMIPGGYLIEYPNGDLGFMNREQYNLICLKQEQFSNCVSKFYEVMDINVHQSRSNLNM